MSWTVVHCSISSRALSGLLRQEKRELQAARQIRPAGFVAIVARPLGAAVQRDDQGRGSRQRGRHVLEHAQSALVGAERLHFGERNRGGDARSGDAEQGRDGGEEANTRAVPAIPVGADPSAVCS